MLKVAITGGPCGGKTEAMSTLTEALEERGYKVLVVPETATELILTGIVPCAELPMYDFEALLLSKQIHKEDIYEQAAKYWGDKVVIFYDRGIADIITYIGTSDYRQLLTEAGITEQDVYSRYDAVLHMTTAAKGAEEHYKWNDPTKEDVGNNAARSESPEEARVKDTETMNAWIGHPHLRVIDNSTDFAGKLERVLEEVFAELGEPIPKEIERKFLIRKPSEEAMETLGVTHTVDIIQTYLREGANDAERRVRQRGSAEDGFSFYYTEKVKIGEGERLEKEERISRDEYIAYLSDADTSLHQIAKKRTCFMSDNQYFEMDCYPFSDEYAVLEVEVNDINEPINFPKELKLVAEITYSPEYYNHSLAKTQTLAEPSEEMKEEAKRLLSDNDDMRDEYDWTDSKPTREAINHGE